MKEKKELEKVIKKIGDNLRTIKKFTQVKTPQAGKVQPVPRK